MTKTLTDLQRLLAAANFAAHRHRGQNRKDNTTAYINHPLALASILANEGDVSDVDVLCAALLHDTVEDTGLTLAELAAEFGPTVARIVEEVSDNKSLPKAERKRLQVEHAPHVSHQAKLVKLADKIANLRDILQAPPADWPLERRAGYFDWAAEVVAGVRGSHPGLEAVFDSLMALRPQI